MRDPAAERAQLVFEKNRDRVVLGRQTGREILAAMEELTRIQEIPLGAGPFPRELRDFWETCVRAERRAEGPLDIRCYALPAGEAYQTGDDVPLFWLDHTTGWFMAESPRLLGELVRLAGLPEEDLEGKTDVFLEYMALSFPDDLEQAAGMPEE